MNSALPQIRMGRRQARPGSWFRHRSLRRRQSKAHFATGIFTRPPGSRSMTLSEQQRGSRSRLWKRHSVPAATQRASSAKTGSSSPKCPEYILPTRLRAPSTTYVPPSPTPTAIALGPNRCFWMRERLGRRERECAVRRELAQCTARAGVKFRAWTGLRRAIHGFQTAAASILQPPKWCLPFQQPKDFLTREALGFLLFDIAE